MSAAIEEVRARLDREERERLERRQARILRERENRVTANMKPHLKGLMQSEAEALHVSLPAFARMLMCEALIARGHNLDKVYREWKAQQEDEE
jgi:hypothetical protein